MTAGRRPGTLLLGYLLLAAVYLLYWPDAQFVLDDWWLFQKFAQAQAQGPRAERELAAAFVQNEVWGSFRTNGLSFLAVFGLSRIAGPGPGFYFLFGVLLHAVVGWLLFRTLVRLQLDRSLAFLAGALFLLLPTAHNPLFWFPSCAHYLISAFWFLIYLHSVAGTIITGALRPRAAAVQFVSLSLALFSGDQIFGLLLLAALWLAVCWRSRAGLICAGWAWVTIAAAGGSYLLFVNRASLGGSMAAKFEFTFARLGENLGRIWSDYEKLAGFSDGYYRVSLIGWGVLAAVAAGLFVFWRMRSDKPPAAPARAFLFGAGLWAAAYGPVLFLRWRELRYDYLPSLGLAVVTAAACVALLGKSPRRLLPAGAGLLVAYGAAAVYADIQQCWRPQSKNLQAIQEQLRSLKDVRYHDIVAISGAPNEIGTAPHFAMFLSYSSTPFVETVTGVWGLVVGQEICYDSGRLGLRHTDFFRELAREDLSRAYVLVSETARRCTVRTLIAHEVRPGQYELSALKGYSGPPLAPGRVYSRAELHPLEKDVFFARSY